MSITSTVKKFFSHTNPNRNFVLGLSGFCIIFCSYLIAQSDTLSKSNTSIDFSLIYVSPSQSPSLTNKSGQQENVNFGINSLANLDDMDWVIKIIEMSLIDIDASAEQRRQILEITIPVTNEIKSIREDLNQTQQQFQESFVNLTGDSQSLEQLRETGVDQYEEISKQWVGMIEGVSKILTLAQRQLLQELIDQSNPKSGWHHWRG